MTGIQGNLSTMSVSDLLQFLAVGRKTGRLKFDRAKIVKEDYLESGLIICSTSNDPKEDLGQILIHYGKLDEPQLQAALQKKREGGGRFGVVLLSSRFL